MNISRQNDPFENEAEINKMVRSLQSMGLAQMKFPDDPWLVESHAVALKSAGEMGKKVLANF